MSFPILYEQYTKYFDNNGIGILSDCIFCDVTEERNGAFSLQMKYPTDGIHFDRISCGMILKAKLEEGRRPQLFRIYSVKKDMSGMATILANHISYDLSGIPVTPFTAKGLDKALESLKTKVPIELQEPFEDSEKDENMVYYISRFNFGSDFDKDTAAPINTTFSLETPSSIRACLGGIEKSILNKYGGEFQFDNYDVILHEERGSNNGVSIKYGKNLTSIQQDINCSNIVTAVLPYFTYKETEETELGEEKEVTRVYVGKVTHTINTDDPNYSPYAFDRKVVAVDFSEEFDDPNAEDLDATLSAAAADYIVANKTEEPIVSLAITYAQLKESEEYKDLNFLESIKLCDTVTVEFPMLGVSATAKVVKIVYDVVKERVKSAVIGSTQTNIADTISSQQKDISTLKKKS